MLLLTAVGLHAGDVLIAHSERRLLEALQPGSPGSRLLCLELMAQAAAAYAGLSAAGDTNSSAAMTPGMLLGSRFFKVDVACALEERLLVGVIRRSPLTGGGLAKFAGTVWSGSDGALQAALDAAAVLSATTAEAAPVVAAVDQWIGVSCLAAADVSVYLPTGEY